MMDNAPIDPIPIAVFERSNSHLHGDDEDDELVERLRQDVAHNPGLLPVEPAITPSARRAALRAAKSFVDGGQGAEELEVRKGQGDGDRDGLFRLTYLVFFGRFSHTSCPLIPLQ